MRYFPLVSLALVGLAVLTRADFALAQPAPLPFKADVIVAADGTGDHLTIQAAVAALPRGSRERRVVWVKEGVYREKVRVDAPCVTIRGESRQGTRLEFAQGADEFRAHPDALGQAVLNIQGDDFVLENLTVENTHGVIGKHAFAIYGRGDRTVIQDCDVLSQGNDTLSLWRTGDGRSAGAPGGANASPNGRYYHARLRVRGSVDFICPRGWCYMVDSEIFEVNPAASAAIWHDGSRDSDMKFVLRRCRFDGVEGWTLARWHHDAQFFLIDCTFSPRMRDRAPYRVIYPLNAGPATDADRARNRELDATNRWGTRAYFHQSRRADGDYPWHADNLERSAQAPKPADITARWTFGGKWDPENANGPTIKSVAVGGERVAVTFSEGVTVKGRPRLRLREGGAADYTSGSGTDTLVFTASTPAPAVAGLDFNGGAILASEAAATLRLASPVLP